MTFLVSRGGVAGCCVTAPVNGGVSGWWCVTFLVTRGGVPGLCV